MDVAELKAELLRLLRDDPDFRAAVQDVMPRTIKALEEDEAPAPEPTFVGPGWLKDKAQAGGPHTQKRFTR